MTIHNANGQIGDRYDQEIIRLYECGWSMDYVAKRLGIKRWKVRDRLIANEIPIRPRTYYQAFWFGTKLSHREIEETVFLYHHMGLSTSEIARRLHKAKSTINWRLVKAGAPPRKRLKRS